jgi:predicted TPR repeat methyltransferase
MSFTPKHLSKTDEKAIVELKGQVSMLTRKDIPVMEGPKTMNLRIGDSILVLTDQGVHYSFDMKNGDLSRINETAAHVLEMADGTHSAKVISDNLAERLGRDKAEKCRKWIEKAVEAGIIIAQSNSEPAVKHKAHELHVIASCLYANSETRKAYLVQKRAIQIEPVDPMNWHQMGELAHAMGYLEEARVAYEHYFTHFPSDPGVAHILCALRNEPPPSRAPDAFVKNLYQNFSVFYEENMCGELQYAAPDRLFSAIKKCNSANTNLIAADLGCGTGLFGIRLRQICTRLIGVDLSPEMLAKAKLRNVYDMLECAEITNWLNCDPQEQFDLITFCDTLIYFGDLQQVVSSCIHHLKPAGFIAFTLEKGEVFPFKLSDSGRFQHHKNHIRDLAHNANVKIVHRSEEVLRLEYGKPVIGLVTVLQKKNGK